MALRARKVSGALEKRAPELYHHYIDDCIGTTSSSKEDLYQYL